MKLNQPHARQLWQKREQQKSSQTKNNQRKMNTNLCFFSAADITPPPLTFLVTHSKEKAYLKDFILLTYSLVLSTSKIKRKIMFWIVKWPSWCPIVITKYAQIVIIYLNFLFLTEALNNVFKTKRLFSLGESVRRIQGK